MYQILEDQLLYLSSKHSFSNKFSFYYQIILSFYHQTFIFNVINIPKVTYCIWFLMIILLLKKGSNTSTNSIFNFFITSIKRFPTLLIMFSSDYFSVSG